MPLPSAGGAGRGHHETRNPWPAARIKRLKQLHADGMSCNGIAREMDCSASAISNQCEKLGLSFDRSQTEAANIARSVDAKARRQAKVSEIYDFLDDTLGHAQSVKTAKDGAGGFKTLTKGEYGCEVQTTLDFIPTTNRKDLAASMVQLVNAATKLEAIDSDSGVADAVSLLGKMAKALGLSDAVDPTGDDDAG